MTSSPVAGEPAGVREVADLETSSDDYAHRFAGPVGEWFLDIQSRTIATLLRDLPPGARVLDVGGGHGQVAPVLAAAGFRVTVAGSATGCAARLRPWLMAGRGRFVTGDLLELPFPDRAFDAVVCIRLLPHSVDVDRLLTELCRVAARRVVIDYPSHRSVNLVARRMFGLKMRVEGNTRPFVVFAPGEVRRRLATRGFVVTAQRPQFMFPMALHRLTNSAGLTRVLEAPWGVLGLRRAFGSPVIVRADRAVSGGGR